MLTWQYHTFYTFIYQYLIPEIFDTDMQIRKFMYLIYLSPLQKDHDIGRKWIATFTISVHIGFYS